MLCDPTMARLAIRILSLVSFLYQAHALHPSVIAGKAFPDILKQAAIDLVDDLQMSRQHALKPGERPFLQSFRQAACDWCRPEFSG